MAAMDVVPVDATFIQMVNQFADYISRKMVDKDAVAVSLAHDIDAHQTMKQLQTTLENLLQLIQSVNERIEQIRGCRKDVHFVTNLARDARLCLWAAKNTESGIVDTSPAEKLDDILGCHYLLVSDKKGISQLSQGTTIPDCQIFFTTKDNFRVQRIMFSSGGHYVLYNGYSISYCANLNRTVEMKLN